MHIQKKKILVCPLNWGLGHAARDVVIIQRLLDLGHEVIIAGDGAALELLRREFPESDYPEPRFTEKETSASENSGAESPKFEFQNSDSSGAESPEFEFQNSDSSGSESPESVTLGSESSGFESSGSESPESVTPKLEILRFPSLIRIRYSNLLPAWLKITLLSPLLFYEILAEHFSLAGIIKKIKPDIVISDNRYGLWNRRVKSILITHQLSLRLPGLLRIFEYPVFLLLKIFIRKFDQCWIPDYPGSSNLSGDLSHRFKLPENCVFIGAVSRFGMTSNLISGSIETHDKSRSNLISGSRIPPLNLLILLSGPEPQRSRLQTIVLKQILSLESGCVILQGNPGKKKRTDLTSSVTMYSHLPASELQNMLISARFVICRSGYTGIMDLARLGKKAMIIPTPGQTEQEYLAEYLAGKGMFLTCRQDELNLESAIHDLSEFNPSFNLPDDDLLGNYLASL